MVLHLCEYRLDSAQGQHLQFWNATFKRFAEEREEDFAKFLLADKVNDQLFVFQKQIQRLRWQFPLLAEVDDAWPDAFPKLR